MSKSNTNKKLITNNSSPYLIPQNKDVMPVPFRKNDPSDVMIFSLSLLLCYEQIIKKWHEVAEKFGGGGHKQAAGCVINKSVEETKEILLKEIKKIL